ncbi:MAG: 4Fe-4S binding protein [Coriobacteriales bacterium]
MQIEKIVFSPTGGTLRVADILAGSLAAQLGARIDTVDLAEPSAGQSALPVAEGTLAVVAMPCFGGRAPRVAMERLAKIQGRGCACVVVSVYGNRAFDDALLEMAEGAAAAGFAVVAAVAAVAEHSIMHQYAAGRPDAADSELLASFAEQIVEKLADDSAGMPQVPGSSPYKKAGAAPLVPKVTGACVSCGTCASGCPVGAISRGDFAADKGACIACMRCVGACPQAARSVSKLMVKAAAASIKKAASIRKECELFM